MYDKILFSLVLSVVSTKLAETFKSDRKLYGDHNKKRKRTKNSCEYQSCCPDFCIHIKNNIKSKGVLNISKFYPIDFSKIKICRPTGTHIGAQRHRRNVACTELLLSQYLLKSHVKIIQNIIRTSKTQIASLSGHLPSYLFIFLTNF